MKEERTPQQGYLTFVLGYFILVMSQHFVCFRNVLWIFFLKKKDKKPVYTEKRGMKATQPVM